MNKSFFPIIGAAIAIVSAAAGRLEAAPTPTCSQNAPLDTECLHVIFHNQSMELVEVGYRNHKETKTRIPLYEYTTRGHLRKEHPLKVDAYVCLNFFEMNRVADERFLDATPLPYT